MKENRLFLQNLCYLGLQILLTVGTLNVNLGEAFIIERDGGSHLKRALQPLFHSSQESIRKLATHNTCELIFAELANFEWEIILGHILWEATDLFNCRSVS